MATLFVTGHSVDERTMELAGLGIWRDMGRKCRVQARVQVALTLSQHLFFKIQRSLIFPAPRRSLKFEWGYQVFMLHRLESSVLVGIEIGGERARRQLSLNQLSVRSIVECTVVVVGCVDRC